MKTEYAYEKNISLKKKDGSDLVVRGVFWREEGLPLGEGEEFSCSAGRLIDLADPTNTRRVVTVDAPEYSRLEELGEVAHRDAPVGSKAYGFPVQSTSGWSDTVLRNVTI